MQARLVQLLRRLESLSLRERLITLLGIPLALVAVGELVVFGPARTQAVEAGKQAERFAGEVKSLAAVLDAQPAAATLPRADQLMKERAEMQRQIEAGGAILASARQGADWGTVVRAAAAGTRGLTLSQLKTLPAEVVFSPSMIKPATTARPGRAPSGAKAAASAARPVIAGEQPASAGIPTADEVLYRHPAELTVSGDFGSLLRYLHTLQGLAGELQWNRLQLEVASYPQAHVRLGLSTFSTRAETPFN